MKTDVFHSSIESYVCARFMVTVCLLISLPSCAYTSTRYCHVYKQKANCSGHGRELTYIPKLGKWINEIVFNNNYLPSVTNDTFLNVSIRNIDVLSIEFNQIQNISANTFDSFIHLETLDISGNNIPENQLRKLLFSLANMSDLRNLFLNSLFLPVPQDLFSQMNGSRLQTVSLRSNNMTNISMGMLENFNELMILDLNNNSIHDVQLPFLKHFTTLHLNSNNLEKVPNFCARNRNNKTNEKESIVPLLSYLYMRGNKLSDITNTSFQCTRNIIQLELSENFIKLFPNFMLSTLPKMRKLNIKYNQLRNFKIEPYAFQSLSLEILIMRNVIFASKLLVSPNETFAHVPKLTYLDIGSISLLDETDEVILQMFNSLTGLTYLSLWGCALTSIPRGFFDNKQRLIDINLSNNMLTSLNHVTFKNIFALNVLCLRDNSIRQIEKDIFNTKTFSKLKLIDLSNNPFVCQCDLQWFIEWIQTREKYTHVRAYPTGYACANPTSMHGKLLADVSFTYRECHPWPVAFWVGVIAGPSLCLLVVIVTLIYRNRWNIKHYVFLMRKRRNYIKIDGDDFLFDAFVGYNQNDYEWVIEQLLPILETQEGYKLCIHDRNFKPGRYIHDNITQCMEDSRKIILVLTNEFAKSGWCTYELKLAHTKHIEDETDLLIVMLEKPEARYMNKSLKLLLETTTYIEWTDDDIGRQLFWEKLKDSMKK